MGENVIVADHDYRDDVKHKTEKGAEEDSGKNALGKKTDLPAQKEEDHDKDYNQQRTCLNLYIVHDRCRLSDACPVCFVPKTGSD